jgi:GMC oxidoreductase
VRTLSPNGEKRSPAGPTVRTEEQERNYLRRSTGSYSHAVGTCRLGVDERAVTDLELRVRGIDGLRVADASVMPSIPGAGTDAAVLAITERGRGNHRWGRPGGRAQPTSARLTLRLGCASVLAGPNVICANASTTGRSRSEALFGVLLVARPEPWLVAAGRCLELAASLELVACGWAA